MIFDRAPSVLARRTSPLSTCTAFLREGSTQCSGALLLMASHMLFRWFHFQVLVSILAQLPARLFGLTIFGAIVHVRSGDLARTLHAKRVA